MAAPVVHFEIHAADPARCRAFYENVFGWATNDVPGMEQQYWLMYPNGKARQDRDEELEGDGIAGGMMMRQGPPPEDGAAVNAYVCVIQVEDIAEAERGVSEHGGHISVPRMEIQGVGQVFYAKDPEGNIFGVLQPA